MKVVIRPGHEADCDAALAVLQAAFAPYRDWLDPPSGVTRETAATLRQKLAIETLLVAEVDGRIIGCVFYKPSPYQARSFYFGRLAVLPAYQRQGIARQLMTAVEQEARRQGLDKVDLSVRLALPANIRLFQSHGFVRVADHAHKGYDTPTFMSMIKSLA